MEAVFGLRAEVQETGAADLVDGRRRPAAGRAGPRPSSSGSHAAEGQAVDRQRLDLVVSAVKPAQVVHRVEVVTATG